MAPVHSFFGVLGINVDRMCVCVCVEIKFERMNKWTSTIEEQCVGGNLGGERVFVCMGEGACGECDTRWDTLAGVRVSSTLEWVVLAQ